MIELTHNELAAQATALFNEMNRRRRAAISQMPAGRGWLKVPQINDEIHADLLDAMTSWDCDPMGTLDELRQQSGYYEDTANA